MTVLFCPLDWGLGHIARDLPLIRWFHDQGHRVVVAASPKIEGWLKKECPSIEVTRFQGPEIRYSRHRHLIFKLIFQLPGLMRWPGKEKKRTAELVREFKPDIIVSDNRYGARHPKVFSAIITHQLMIKMPGTLKWAEWPLHKLIRFLLHKFDELWIPDFDKEHSLAGDLVHKFPLPSHARLIGPLSRFNSKEDTSTNKQTPLKGILAIVSGPEPQRSIFEQKIRAVAPTLPEQTTLITGTPTEESRQGKKSNNLEEFPHLCTDALQKSIQSNRIVIARSGYSTIMDMFYLRRKIWLVPTPGQTEQMYLADFHKKKGHHILSQGNLFQDLADTMEKPFFQHISTPAPIFHKALTELLNSAQDSSKQNRHSSSKKSFQ